MKKSSFDEQHVLHELKHYLPAQAPLKDFVHHNTLHAFQKHNFHTGLQMASEVFGYKVYMLLDEYRKMHKENKISHQVLENIICQKKGNENLNNWLTKLIDYNYATDFNQRIGEIRALWKSHKKINFDKDVHTNLFRLVGNYLDQGIGLEKFPIEGKGFLASIRKLEKESLWGMFKSKRVKDLLLHSHFEIEDLLDILIGNVAYYDRYLFDQQFAHPGWSGMVSFLEINPESLLQKRKISLHDFIVVELLMEIESLDIKFNHKWNPLADSIPDNYPTNLFDKIETKEIFEVYALWQEAFEFSYYDSILKGLQTKSEKSNSSKVDSFQAIFCIDDRECSLRRHIEAEDKKAETFSTAGFFNIEFFFQPDHGKFYTKSCPAPLTPNYLVKETDAKIRHQKEAHFSQHNSGFLGGLFTSPTLGFWSAINMTKSIFYPTESPVIVSSFKHMDENGKLSLENKNPENKVHDLQIGFSIQEMANRMEGLFRQIGLINNFASLVYFIGHGASSVNNTHYAGYDCGACCGRAGSVNARAAAFMSNHQDVRKVLNEKGINIPDTTQFIGALHDTTRDEIYFYDENVLSEKNKNNHQKNKFTIENALHNNSKERARRFQLMNSNMDSKKVHEKIRLRSLSLFEPRPEWNHATNTACIIGKRENNKHLFFDRRAFLNSYDYSIDPNGEILLGILKAIAPVCGGINLEYYFSRNDNYRLGAGSKLPHNVMGLIGVANGMDGDLRPGLPYQMINIHDPLRLLVTVEHYPDVVLKTIILHQPTYEWFINEWIHLVAIHPETKELFIFRTGKFERYEPTIEKIEFKENIMDEIMKTSENIPVYQIS